MELYENAKKACPFCGGYDALYIGDEKGYNERLDTAERDGYERMAALSIKCMRCKLRLSVVSADPYWAARELLTAKYERRRGDGQIE